MKLRGLIVAGVVLAALTGALYWSNKHPVEDTARTDDSAEAAPKILSIKEADIVKFDLKPKGKDQVSVQRDTSGKWQMTAPKPLPVDQSAVQSLLGTFSSFGSERVVEDKASTLDQYGLSSPVLEVDLTEKDKKSQRLLLGDQAPTGNTIYAKLADDPHVYLIASFQQTSIDKSANDLRDKRLLTVSPDKISQVELVKKNGDVAFARSKDSWQIVKPSPARADDYQVDQMVRKLAQAQMDLSGNNLDDAKTAAAFASGTPVVMAKVTDPSGTQQLEIRKNKDDYYAKSSVVSGVYKVANDLPQAVDKGPDDFRDKKLFDFGYNDPDKLEIHNGDKSYFLSKGGNDWWSGDGKKLDPDGADTVLSDVRDLSAKTFVDSGFTTPVLQVSVLSDKGKRLEKVLIAKSGKDYVAKREGETALYQIDDDAIKNLQKALDELKPASATSAAKPAVAAPAPSKDKDD